MQIAGERLSNVRWQWKVFAPALRLDYDLAPPPVDVIQLQVGHLQRAQAQTRQQRDDREVTPADRAALVAPDEQPGYFVCRQVTG